MASSSRETSSAGAGFLPPQATGVIISVNPKAGRRAAQPTAERLAAFLAARGLQARILTDLAEVAARAAEGQARGDLRAVVAAGGDGTVAEIVNRVPVGVPVAVLPLGTENLLAKHLGIGRQPESVGEAIVQGAVVRLDAGRAVSSAGEARGRIFLLLASCGLDADVVHRLEQARRGHISHLSYIKPIVAAFRNYKYPPLRIELRGSAERCRETRGTGAASLAMAESPLSAAGAAWSQETPVVSSIVARWMFLFNLPCYARGLPFAPRACGTDGRLDLCAFGRGSFWNGMRYLVSVLRGRHDQLADCTLQQVTGLRVEADEPVPFQLDGDFGGHLPLDIEILPRRLTLVVPEAWRKKII